MCVCMYMCGNTDQQPDNPNDFRTDTFRNAPDAQLSDSPGSYNLHALLIICMHRLVVAPTRADQTKAVHTHTTL